MAFRAVVVATIVAFVSAGMDPNYMNSFGGMMQQNSMQDMMHNFMQNMMHQNTGHAQGGGCDPATDAGGCHIPQGVDVGEYLQQQMQNQQSQTKQMTERMKAQFERVMQELTMKKHRYAMSVMTEFTSMCACAEQSYNIYQAMFVENAKNLNLTDVVDMHHDTLPYMASSAKEARELIFAGLVTAMCTNLGEYMNFVQQVENNIPIYETSTATGTPIGK